RRAAAARRDDWPPARQRFDQDECEYLVGTRVNEAGRRVVRPDKLTWLELTQEPHVHAKPLRLGPERPVERPRAAQDQRRGGRRQQRDAFEQEVPALFDLERAHGDQQLSVAQLVAGTERAPRPLVQAEQIAV